MAQARSLDSSERLPWLSDASRPQPRQARRSWYPLLFAVTAAGAIAFGGWSLVERGREQDPASKMPARTVPLPPPSASSAADAEPQARSPSEVLALRPAAEPDAARAAPAAPVKPAASTRKAEKRISAAQSRAIAAPRSEAAAASPYQPRAWASGVRGRIIQLGAFRTSAQAQAEWRRVYARYPLLRPLSPRVLKSKVRGRTYYRLQLGTFSHAHSELLCQRLRTLGEGCRVLGLSGTRR